MNLRKKGFEWKTVFVNTRNCLNLTLKSSNKNLAKHTCPHFAWLTYRRTNYFWFNLISGYVSRSFRNFPPRLPLAIPSPCSLFILFPLCLASCQISGKKLLATLPLDVLNCVEVCSSLHWIISLSFLFVFVQWSFTV